MMYVRTFACTALATILVLLPACSSSNPPTRNVLMPPRLDLHAFGTIGMFDFVDAGSHSLGGIAAQEFLSVVQSAQPGTPVLELGLQRHALATIGHTALTPDAIRALGERHHIDSLMVGTITTKPIQPSFSLHSIADGLRAGAGADIAADLHIRLYDTHSGATVWSATSHARETLAKIYVRGDDFASVSANNPNDSETRLVHTLINGASGDLWPYWVRQ